MLPDGVGVAVGLGGGVVGDGSPIGTLSMSRVGVRKTVPSGLIAVKSRNVEPATVGVPLIVRVATSKVSPSGRGVPALRSTVGAGAPVAVSW